MKNSTIMRVAAAAAVFLLSSNPARAGEKKLMHCFAWTSIKEATPADWEAFFKASDALPGKIKGISKVWYGKLAAPLGQTAVTRIDPDNLKKLRAGETATGEVTRTPRDWGMCMEMSSAAVREAYGSHPYHKIWTDAYAKIRVDGTTTFDILGQ